MADYFPEEDRNKASEAMQLFKEANRMLDLLDKDYEVRTIFKLCKANSDGDNLVIEKETGQFLVFPCSASRRLNGMEARSFA